MKRLGIYELALPYKKFQYRLDYFILLLMLIRKEDHYRDFSKMFIKIGSKVIELLKEIDKTLSGNLKEDIGNSKMHDVHDEKDRIETFIETFCNYIETVQEFNEERIVESTASLFDLKKLKYKNSFILSLKRCHSYYR